MNCKSLLCAVLFGVFVFGGADSGALQQKEEPKKAAEGNDLINSRKAKLKAAKEAYRLYFAKWDGGALNDPELEFCHLWSLRVVEAELELASGKNSRIESFTNHRKRMLALAETVESRKDIAGILKAQLAAVDYYVKEADLSLEQCKKDPK